MVLIDPVVLTVYPTFNSQGRPEQINSIEVTFHDTEMVLVDYSTIGITWAIDGEEPLCQGLPEPPLREG